jgi:DNA-binding XRE family transcriptional regulator
MAVRPFRLDFTPLRRRRRELEITQGDLADSAGISRQTVWRTERNLTVPSAWQLIAIARALGAPATDLFSVIDQ